MNQKIIKTLPSGDFEEISNLMPNWKSRFLSLVQQRKRIKYLLTMMPQFPDEVEMALSDQGYCEYILESDNRQHFLVPQFE